MEHFFFKTKVILKETKGLFSIVHASYKVYWLFYGSTSNIY